jgi:transcription elongation factor GreA
MEEKIFHVTKGKLKELKKEYNELVVFEHHKTVEEEAPKMLESEDINAEFISYHEDMDSLRSRIDELKDILEHHVLIKNPPKEKQQSVDLGATVKVDINGKKNEFVIVGTLEANPILGKISNESPVGKALLGHKIGDEVVIHEPKEARYTIKSIKYEVS